MIYAVGWFVVLVLLGLWSLAAWSFHAITAWTAANAGALVGGATDVPSLQWPAWVAPWIPSELTQLLGSMLSALEPAIQAMLTQAPALAGGFSAAVWIVWGVGSVLLIVTAAALHGLFALLRRRASA